MNCPRCKTRLKIIKSEVDDSYFLKPVLYCKKCKEVIQQINEKE